MRLKAGIIIFLALIVISVPLIFLGRGVDLSMRLSSPSLRAPLGYDDMGRNYLAELAAGTLVSLFLAFTSVGVAVALGLGIAYLLALASSWRETLLALLDGWRMLPITVIAVFLSSLMRLGEERVIIVLSAVYTPMISRLSYMRLIEIRERPYILFLRKSGVSPLRIFFRHEIRDLWLSIGDGIVNYFSGAILLEATLSYLGLGVRVETPSLGSILSGAKAYALSKPLLLFAPTLVLLVIGIALHLVASSLGEFDSPLKGTLERETVDVAELTPNRETRGEARDRD